ncbi:MAG: hypothetical protein ACPL07_00550, partial [Candidatus Bathyarchaeia archaeon]
MKLLSSFITKLREEAFKKTLIGKVISIFLSSSLTGGVAFRVSILIKVLSLQEGLCDQRAVEYPWVLI